MFRRTVAVLAAAAALTSACGADDTAAGPVAATAPTSSRSTAAAQEAPAGTSAPAPDALRFTAPLVGGGDIDLTGYTGQPVLLWFWAPY